MIENKGDAGYIGQGIYNLTGAGQTKTQTVPPATTAINNLEVANAGNASDSIQIKGANGSSTCQVRYYDTANSGGTDITSQVTGSGWIIGSLASGGTRAFRVEVTPASTVAGSVAYSVKVTASSMGQPTAQDAAVASTTVAAVYQPDATIRVQGVTPITYFGQGIFNSTGASQTVTAKTAAGKAVTYLMRLYNAGNATDTLSLTGPAGGSGWTVQYFNADSGGTDITSQVTGSGWTTPSLAGRASLAYLDLRVEVTPDSTVVSGAYLDVLVTFKSIHDKTKVDAVKGTTTKD